MLSDFLHCKVTSVSKNLKCKVKGHFLPTLRIVTFWRCEQNKDNAIDIIIMFIKSDGRIILVKSSHLKGG